MILLLKLLSHVFARIFLCFLSLKLFFAFLSLELELPFGELPRCGCGAWSSRTSTTMASSAELILPVGRFFHKSAIAVDGYEPTPGDVVYYHVQGGRGSGGQAQALSDKLKSAIDAGEIVVGGAADRAVPPVNEAALLEAFAEGEGGADLRQCFLDAQQLYASPLTRTIQTALVALQHHPRLAPPLADSATTTTTPDRLQPQRGLRLVTAF